MLADADTAWKLVTLGLRIAIYAAALMGAGSAAFALLFRPLDPQVVRATAGFTTTFALLGLLASLLAVPIQTGYLAGGDWRGMLDVELLTMVARSPVGWASVMAAVGSSLLLLIRAARPATTALAVLGGVIVLASVTVAGHGAARDPVLGRFLVSVHLAAAAFWIGALWPLLHIARMRPGPEAAVVLERFGQVATVVVGALLVAGTGLAVILLENVAALWQTRYGVILIAKLAAVSALLALAALNRQRLVPDLARGTAGGQVRLVRSIRTEIVLGALILGLTATLTTFSTPFG